MPREIRDGEATVILVRLDSLDDAIRGGSREEVQFEADRVRSSVERALGVRGREVDELREKAATSPPRTRVRTDDRTEGGTDG